MKISIIIVHYKVMAELFACLASVEDSRPNTPYEIIVVDNDEKKTIYKDLHKQFPQVNYIPNKNKGFGQGNNIGAKHAKGEYLFFLNPDTAFQTNAIDTLLSFAREHKKAGVIAPLLLDMQGRIYPLQGTKELTPFRAIIALSFINKRFPFNPVSKDFWMTNWNKKEVKQVDTVPGTAFMIKKDLFERIGGFDEQFFLYFEEYDLCKRVRHLGLDCYILPHAQVKHAWGSSTKQLPTANIFFTKSKFYYFRKHYGLLNALMVKTITEINKVSLLLATTVILGFFLLSFQLSNYMMFIGDFGWFYLAARDMLLTGDIPLIGIPSSHLWLHQGAYWTYLMAGILKLCNFHPLAGGILAIIFGILTIAAIYFLGKRMFSSQIGLIVAALYASSPLVIVHARMPYHTAPIPLFTILYFYSFYKWQQGSISYFPLAIVFLAVLYNFEIATIVLAFPLLILIVFGLVKKKAYVTKLFRLKTLALSIIAFAVPMLPMLLYDISNGFPQTFRVVMWFGYRVFVLFGYPPLHPEIEGASLSEFFSLSLTWLSRLVFAQDSAIALVIFATSVLYFGVKLYKDYKNKEILGSNIIIVLWLLFGLGGYLVNRVPSEAYLPMLFPLIFLLEAILFIVFFQKQKIIALTLLFFLIGSNITTLLQNNYYLDQKDGYGASFATREDVVNAIINEVDGKQFQLRGEGRQFESFTMNYEYLLWWKGHPPAKAANTTVTIREEGTMVIYKIHEKNK